MITTTGQPAASAPPHSYPAHSGVRPVALLAVLLGDLVAPVGVYYAARSAGAAAWLALTLGGVACLPRQLAELVRRRRVDALGAVVLASFALGCLLSVASGDVRFLVVKDAIWPLTAGAMSLGSCLRGKPVTFFVFRPMLTGGRAENRAFWDTVFANGGAFRRCLRVLALCWSVILLGTGAVELILAFSLPLSIAAAVPAAIPVICVPLLLGCTGLYAQRTGLGVRRSLEAMNRAAPDGAR